MATTEGEALFPTIAQSLAVYGNDVVLVSATLTASTTGTVSFQLGVSNNNDGTGITWESVTSGVSHNFVASGKWLYWKAVGNSGSTCTSLNIVVVE